MEHIVTDEEGRRMGRTYVTIIAILVVLVALVGFLSWEIVRFIAAHRG